MKILNSTRKNIVATKAKLADTFLSRAVGLLNRKGLDDEEALLITRCRSIHMFFMRFPIDVIFVDSKDVVVGLVESIRPFRLSPYFWKAEYAVELPVGTIQKAQIQLGDLLKIE